MWLPDTNAWIALLNTCPSPVKARFRATTPSQIALCVVVKSELFYGASADTTLRLARDFGASAEFWLGLRADFDLNIARKKAGRIIEREVAPMAMAA